MSEQTYLENLYTEELYKLPGRVLVLIPKSWSQVSENERTVLSKMLVAVKLNLASVQILTKAEVSLADLAAFTPERVLGFGVTMKGASRMYEHHVVEGTSIILADALEDLDDVKKKNLWGALKQMFQL